jgi:hypothetical protein
MFGKQLKWLEERGAEMAVKIMEQSMMNDWQGLFELKGGGNENHDGIGHGRVDRNVGNSNERVDKSLYGRAAEQDTRLRSAFTQH